MKIAISADSHLRTRSESQEQYEALEDVLSQCVNFDVDMVFFAGDVFDKSLNDYSDFDKLCKRKEYQKLQIKITPGNHDEDLKASFITAENVEIVGKPTWVQIDDNLSALLIPYLSEKVMGEIIEECFDEKPTDNWILVGHGNWTEGLALQNPLEPGVYMPLTRRDVQKYDPTLVFLGHIHKHVYVEGGKVFYPGSPCGLDITETGMRYFLLFDTTKMNVIAKRISSPRIYFDERILIIPDGNEAEQFKSNFTQRIEEWGLASEDYRKVRLRLYVSGYCLDKKGVVSAVEDAAKVFQLHQEPMFDDLLISNDYEKEQLINQFKEALQDHQFTDSEDEPNYDSIMNSVLKLVFEE